MQQKAFYFFIRFITFPLGFCPLFMLRFLGRIFGSLGFYILPKYRKRTLSNLAMANLSLDKKQRKKLAKASLQNLMINCLEYPKFYYTKNLRRFFFCKNPQEAKALYDSGKGILFFCGHQANWEALFLDGTSRMKGLTIGKPAKNDYLYNWVVKIRERFSGEVINPKGALKKVIKALKQGTFVGIVGDQGNPESDYSYPLFGRRAFISSIPAVLAYKTGSPLFVAMTKRISKGYELSYSDPFWPNLKAPIKEEVPRLMDLLLKTLETSIQKAPSEWLWSHNRWKTQNPAILHKKYRHDVVAFFLPLKKETALLLLPLLKTLFSLYEKEYTLLRAPKVLQPLIEKEFFGKKSFHEVIYIEKASELFFSDCRPKLIFNFSGEKKLKRHFLKQSAFWVLNEKDFFSLSKKRLFPGATLQDACLRTLCRPYSLWKPEDAS